MQPGGAAQSDGGAQPVDAARPVGWRPGGTAIVAGVQGQAVACWLADRGAQHLLLTGVPDAEAVAAHAGVPVTVLPEPAELGAPAESGEVIDTVVCTVGQPEETPIGTLTVAELGGALDAAASAWRLADGASDALLLCSLAGTFGGIGQASLAVADVFLAALAQSRRMQGRRMQSRPTQSKRAQGDRVFAVAMGPWPDTDPRIAQARAQRLGRRGVGILDPSQALSTLGTALDHDDEPGVIADLRWPDFAASLAAARPARLLAALPEAALPVGTRPVGTLPATTLPDGTLPAGAASFGGTAATGGASVAQRLAAANPAERTELLTGLVLREAAAVLGYPDPAALPTDRALLELGFDSLTSIELRTRVTSLTGLSLTPAMILDNPTVADLASLGAGTASQASSGLLTEMFLRSRDQGTEAEFMDLLGETARFRPAFTGRGAQRLAGAAGRRTWTVAGMPAQRAGPVGTAPVRPARRRGGGPAPGPRPAAARVRAGEPLPGGVTDAAAALADCVLANLTGAPFALVGYSSGGLLAHAVAERLAGSGDQPVAVVLADTWLLDDSEPVARRRQLAGPWAGWTPKPA